MIIRPVADHEMTALHEHLDRHLAENGEGGLWFGIPDSYPLLLDDPELQTIIGLFTDDRIVGSCLITRYDLPALSHRGVLSLGLEGPARGQGYGRQLMQAGFNAAKAMNLEYLDGYAIASNERVLRLDYDMGWLPIALVADVARTPEGKSLDQILLVNRL